MKRLIEVSFSASGGPDEAQAIFDLARIGPDVAKVDYHFVWGQCGEVVLEEMDARLPVLRQLLEQKGRTWDEFHWDSYSEEEMDSAPLLFLFSFDTITSHGGCTIDDGARWGMQYDLAKACPACGSGARQTSSVFVDGEQLSKLKGHSVCVTYCGNILVDEGFAAHLESLDLKGVSFRSVYARMPGHERIKLQWEQLRPKRALPPMSPRSVGLKRDRTCRMCRRNIQNHWPVFPRFVYQASDLRAAGDLNLSWEHHRVYDGGRKIPGSPTSYPWILATPKIRRAFLDAGVTGFEWLPIRVEDS